MMKILAEDDDTVAAKLIDELKNHLKGSEVEQKLVLIEEAIAEYYTVPRYLSSFLRSDVP